MIHDHSPCPPPPCRADPISAFNISQAQQLAGRKLLLTERGVAEGLARGSIQVQEGYKMRSRTALAWRQLLQLLAAW